MTTDTTPTVDLFTSDEVTKWDCPVDGVWRHYDPRFDLGTPTIIARFHIPGQDDRAGGHLVMIERPADGEYLITGLGRRIRTRSLTRALQRVDEWFARGVVPADLTCVSRALGALRGLSVDDAPYNVGVRLVRARRELEELLAEMERHLS